jgi:hypothetical protein
MSAARPTGAVGGVVEQLVVERRPISAHHDDVVGIPAARLEMASNRLQQEHQPFVEHHVLREPAFLFRHELLDAEVLGDLLVFVLVGDFDKSLRWDVNRVALQRFVGVEADAIVVQDTTAYSRGRHHDERGEVRDSGARRIFDLHFVHTRPRRRFPRPAVGSDRREPSLLRVNAVETRARCADGKRNLLARQRENRSFVVLIGEGSHAEALARRRFVSADRCRAHDRASREAQQKCNDPGTCAIHHTDRVQFPYEPFAHLGLQMLQ